MSLMCHSQYLLANGMLSHEKAPNSLSGAFYKRAGDENRTRVVCLEGRGSTIELHPRAEQCEGYGIVRPPLNGM